MRTELTLPPSSILRIAALIGLLLAPAWALWPAAARAEDVGVYEVEGDADASAGDPRVAAWSVRVAHFESLHPHDAVASVSGRNA